MAGMNLTKSQKTLLNLGRVAVPEHRIDVVKVETPRSGLSTIIKRAVGESKIDHKTPLSVCLCATSNWDVVVSLNEVAGGGVLGYGFLTAYLRGLEKIANNARRDELCIWLEHAGNLSIPNQETIAQRATWAADRIGVRVHLIYLLQKIQKWDGATHAFVRGRNISSHVTKNCAEWEFTDEGLDALEISETPRAVRSA